MKDNRHRKEQEYTFQSQRTLVIYLFLARGPFPSALAFSFLNFCSSFFFCLNSLSSSTIFLVCFLGCLQRFFFHLWGWTWCLPPLAQPQPPEAECYHSTDACSLALAKSLIDWLTWSTATTQVAVVITQVTTYRMSRTVHLSESRLQDKKWAIKWWFTKIAIFWSGIL